MSDPYAAISLSGVSGAAAPSNPYGAPQPHSMPNPYGAAPQPSNPYQGVPQAQPASPYGAQPATANPYATPQLAPYPTPPATVNPYVAVQGANPYSSGNPQPANPYATPALPSNPYGVVGVAPAAVPAPASLVASPYGSVQAQPRNAPAAGGATTSVAQNLYATPVAALRGTGGTGSPYGYGGGVPQQGVVVAATAAPEPAAAPISEEEKQLIARMEKLSKVKTSPEDAIRKIQDFVRRMGRKKRFKELLHKSMARRKRLKDRDKLQQKIWEREKELAKMKRFLADKEIGGPRTHGEAAHGGYLSNAVNELVEYTEVDAAVKIQSLFRGHSSRKQKVEKMTAAFKHRFILKMQRLYRKRALRKSGLVGTTRNREMDENRDREIAYRLGKRVEAKDVRLRSGFAGFGSEYSSSTPSAEEYYKENVFARPMTAEAMKGIEEHVGKKMEGYKEANVTAYANSELELEEKAHECYRKFNEDAKLRRRDAQRLHLGKLQVNQMSYAMEHATLGDTRFVNLDLAPKEFMDAALEKHKRRHLQWWQQHSKGRRMTRKEAVELSLQDVGDSQMTKADDSESDALGELEKLLGYDFTPFDPMDALRAHQRPRITPQDLRLTAEQAQKLGVEQNSVLASSVSGPLLLGAGATAGAAAVGGNGNGVGDTNPAAEQGGSATAAAASPAPAIVVSNTVAVGGAAVVSNTVTIAGAAPQPQPQTQTQSVVPAQGVISSSASSQTPPGGAAASVAAAGEPPVVNRAVDLKPPLVASEMPGGEGVGVVAKTDSLLVSESDSRPESKEKGGSAGGGAGHADAAGEEKAYVRVEADISPGVLRRSL